MQGQTFQKSIFPEHLFHSLARHNSLPGSGVGIDVVTGPNGLGHSATTPRPDLPLITPRRRLQLPVPTTSGGSSGARTGRSGNTFFQNSNNPDKATHIEVTKECMSCICEVRLFFDPSVFFCVSLYFL